MEIVYIAHCVPWPPDKGDRIRAFHVIQHLVKNHRVHLVCLTRNAADAMAPSPFGKAIASLRIEVLNIPGAALRGLFGIAAGCSFTTAFHTSPALRRYVRLLLADHPIHAAVVLSSSMAGYAPANIPFLADWGDVDSQKRLDYAKMRRFGWAQRLEALRMRTEECAVARRAHCTFMTTVSELQLFQRMAPGVPARISGNGVDTEYFDPRLPLKSPSGLRRGQYLLFVGMLDYFPNSDAACWFAREVFPALRRRNPDLDLMLVGRNPGRDVIALARQDGVSVTGAVPDVRPYLAGARAVIAPLRIARGVQNKVLEALAMGKRVLASEPVCQTLRPDLPPGITCCTTPADYIEAAEKISHEAAVDWAIADAARLRFSWPRNLETILTELSRIETGGGRFDAGRAAAAR
jgi:sugar transferase (PEP-CTERM/EpsH1 system associated)